MNLFIRETFTYPDARTTLQCGPITTRLLGIEEQYPEITHYPDTREVSVLATDPVFHVD